MIIPLRPKEPIHNHVLICGGRCVIGAHECARSSIEITSGRISRITSDPSEFRTHVSGRLEIDLSGFLIMPGLINAHDHLEFSLFPRMGNQHYRNYIDWGTDIHNTFPDIIAKQRSVPKDLRLWCGGIRNLLCGATTVSHHNPLWPDLLREDFPVRVVHKYGWGHSLALGGDLRSAHAQTPKGGPFIVHACEGVDELSRDELCGLDRLGLMDADTVLVHGLAIDRSGVALMQQRGSSLIVCPSSNDFLFGKLPDMTLLSNIDKVALGNDSPLTSEGDLLDEIRFAIRFCNISPQDAYRMVTESPAAILHLQNAEGSLKESGLGDLFAIRDTGEDAAFRLQTLSMTDVELVMIGGRVYLASDAILPRLPSIAAHGLEPLWIDGNIRWLRAPVKDLLRETEEALGRDGVHLGGKPVRIPSWSEAQHA
jgi:amidohydrolase family protein